MNIAARRSIFSWFTFWIVLAIVSIYFLWPLRQTLRYGIDLVGGTYITLEVQTEKAVENELLSRLQGMLTKLKESGKEQPTAKNIEKNAIVLSFASTAAAQNAALLLQSYDKDVAVSASNDTIRASLTEGAVKRISQDAVSRDVEVLRSRLNRLSVEEISIAAQGERNIVIELPDVSDPQQAKEMIGRSALLEFRLVQKSGRTPEDILYELDGILPGDMEILPGKEEADGKPSYYYLVPKFSDVTGKSLRDAYAQLDQQKMQTNVTFKFSAEGGDKFYDLTSKNIGKSLAVVLDGVVITAPTINSGIRNEGYIEGRFTPDEAKQLALLLKSGAFVAPVTFEEERQIGPSLGMDSIKKGLVSCAVGLGLLFLFSVFFYSWCGVLAFITLLFNLLLILLAMSLLCATLTLPGIAGLVLTIGMAIDSSILIFEQIREALAAGMPIRKAVSSGFSDALVVILDANITTFIVGVVLYYFGTGPIRGFAVTMMLGIISTLLTGLYFLKSTFTFILDRFHIQKLRI